MIIGGSDVFAEAMPLADRLEITDVHASPEGDVYFPTHRSEAIGARSRARSTPPGPDDSASFAVATYLRR